MRSAWPRTSDVPLAVDVVIGLALCATVTFFIIVMEFCVGQGELTHAQLLLLRPRAHSMHVSAVNKHGRSDPIWDKD